MKLLLTRVLLLTVYEHAMKTLWQGSASMKAHNTSVLCQVRSLSFSIYLSPFFVPHTGLITAVDATMKVANKASVYSRTNNGKMQVVNLFAGGLLTGVNEDKELMSRVSSTLLLPRSNKARVCR